MGQQQLLLLVLGIVIVGLAVVAGINAFDENQRKSSQDALTQEAFRYATDAKAWFQKPEQFGGAGADNSSGTTTADLTWNQLGVESTSDDSVKTPWGKIGINATSSKVEFEVSTTNGGSFGKVTFTPNSDPAIEFSRSGSGDDTSS